MTIWSAFTRQSYSRNHPQCLKCGLSMGLTRISPIRDSSPLRIERSYECQCGEKITVEELNTPSVLTPGDLA